jgi:hypothetical protein
MRWPWFLGLAIVVPLLLYLFGYFWTKGSMVAKKDFIDNSIIGDANLNNHKGEENDRRF